MFLFSLPYYLIQRKILKFTCLFFFSGKRQDCGNARYLFIYPFTSVPLNCCGERARRQGGMGESISTQCSERTYHLINMFKIGRSLLEFRALDKENILEGINSERNRRRNRLGLGFLHVCSPTVQNFVNVDVHPWEGTLPLLLHCARAICPSP